VVQSRIKGLGRGIDDSDHCCGQPLSVSLEVANLEMPGSTQFGNQPTDLPAHYTIPFRTRQQGLHFLYGPPHSMESL